MRLLKSLRSSFFSTVVRLRSKRCGSRLRVNHWSVVGKNTILGNNVNFNGMRITGGGTVEIGDNFHSGKGCLMITQNHNYDGGTAVPYDSTVICKNIKIEDNVWLGTRVIVLGGGNDRRRCNYSSG